MNRLLVLPLLTALMLPGPGLAKQPEHHKSSRSAKKGSPDTDEGASQPSSDVAAADEEDQADRAQPQSAIVVTAHRLDVARTRIDQGLGATVYSLNNDTIENRPGGETGSVASVLAQAPGTGLSSSSITIRGSRSIQVRINGVVLPESIGDPADQLSSRLAQTTRLVTGTLPAQFGFAPAGVISVTTKNGLYERGGQVELFAGSHDMLEPAVEWAGSAGATSLFATGSLERGRSRIEDAFGRSAADRRYETEGLAFADHVLGPNDRMSLILGGVSQRQRISETSLPAGSEQKDDGFAVGAFQHTHGPLSVQAAISLAGASDRSNFDLRDTEHRSSKGAQLDASYEVGSGHRLTVGGLLIDASVWDSMHRRSKRTSLGIYAQDEWSIAPRFTINAGLRADWVRGMRSGAKLEPRASAVWRAQHGLTAHLGYAGYAAAAPLEEERAARLPTERDDYVDAGAQQKLGPWTFGLDAYSRSARNFLDERKVLGTAAPAAFSFARARFRGVEVSATYARGPLSAWANAAFSKSEARKIIAGQDLFAAAAVAATSDHWVQLASDRPVSASAGLGWRTGKLSLSADLLAGSGAVRTLRTDDPNGSRAPAFLSVGLAAVYHARLLGQAADLRADLTNLTNVHYLANEAANLEGGWTRFAEGRAILVGIEQGF